MNPAPAIFACAALAFAAAQPPDTAAQNHALDTATPAYVDFERGEIIVREGQPAAVINLYRTGDFRQSTRVSFATEEITASEGRDYRGTGGTITFQPGEGVKQIVVPLIPDEIDETGETFRVNLSEDGPNMILMRDAVTVEIEDAAFVAPRLQIASAGPGKILVAWESSGRFVLERSRNACDWEAVPEIARLEGRRSEVLIETGAAVHVYRLKAVE
jgi:hypothetical protein